MCNFQMHSPFIWGNYVLSEIFKQKKTKYIDIYCLNEIVKVDDVRQLFQFGEEYIISINTNSPTIFYNFDYWVITKDLLPQTINESFPLCKKLYRINNDDDINSDAIRILYIATAYKWINIQDEIESILDSALNFHQVSPDVSEILSLKYSGMKFNNLLNLAKEIIHEAI